jgi:hypothetical protein
VIVLNSLASKFVRIGMAVLSSTGIEQELFIDLEEALVPEQVFVEDISRDNLGGDSTCKIFNSLSVGHIRNDQE